MVHAKVLNITIRSIIHKVLFLQVASYIVLLSAVCVDIVKPVTGSKKRRKKRQTGSEDGKSEVWRKVSLTLQILSRLVLLVNPTAERAATLNKG